MIRKTKGGYKVLSHKTGKCLGTYKTKKEAENRLKQIKGFSNKPYKQVLLEKHGLEKPFRIRDGKHKYAVFVKNQKTKRINIIKFGAVGYEDYLGHKDKERRRRFKARHKCSEKIDKLKAGWWSCNYSW